MAKGNQTRDATYGHRVQKSARKSRATGEKADGKSAPQIDSFVEEDKRTEKRGSGSKGKERIQREMQKNERSYREFQGRERERTGGRSKGATNDFSETKSDFLEGNSISDKKLSKVADAKISARKKYEKARKSTQKTTYSMEKVFDEQTGTYSYKVVANHKDVKTGKILQKHKISKRMVYEAAAVARAKGMEGADDNDAVDAASALEQTGERLFDFVKKHGKSKAQRKYDKLSKAQKKLQKAEAAYDKKKFQYDTKKEYEKWLSQNPKLQEKNASHELQKQMQKRRIKKQYMKSAKNAKNAEKTAQVAAETAKKTTMIAKKLQEFIAAHAKIIVVIGLFALLLVVIMSMLSSCAAMLGNSVSTTMASTYLSEPAQIDAAALQISDLETGLQEQINSIETDYPDYDEYDYNLGEIGVDPAVLINYLSAKYTEFTAADVSSEIEAIFNEMYTLTLTPDTETRTRTVTKTRTVTDPETGEETEEEYEEEEEYEVEILRVTLSVKSIDEIAGANLTQEQREMFDVYQETRGALQVFASPVDYYWYDYISSYYGYRIHPISGQRQLHRGVDIAIPEGTSIYASHDGTIAEAGYDDSFGNYIVITDDQGYTTKYGHLSYINVSAGQHVRKGIVIGKTGNTGASTGSHLHFECLYNGEYYNPLFYFNCGSRTMYGENGGGSGAANDYVLPDSFSDAQVGMLLGEADKYVGTPYVWGGSNPSTGFDCSGFVCWSFKASGTYELERTTAQGIYNKCAVVSPGEEKPGDIIFFTGTYSSGNPVTHVGIVVEPGIMVHAGDPIKYSSYATSYWQSHFYGFGRLAQ